MARVSILVMSSPIDSQNASSALRFARTVLASEHELAGVFFYQQGVQNANSFSIQSSDEYGIYTAWSELSHSNHCPLLVCVSAATQRGVISAQDAADNDLAHFNLTAPFESVGLGDLAALLHNSDRLVQF